MKHPFYLLFKEGELVCYSKYTKGTRVYHWQELPKFAEFFSINPLLAHDNNPTQDYHRRERPRRADCNVSAYRNILVELDMGTIQEQMDFINQIDMPFTMCTYSGKKSLHYIISLETDVDKESYQKLVRRLYEAINSFKELKVDVACRNPSRLSRMPGAFRNETMKRQDLVAVKDKVNNQILNEWIESVIGPEVETKIQYDRRGLPVEDYTQHTESNNKLRYSTKLFLIEGASEGSRNTELFKAACNLFECGYSYDDILHLISTIRDFDLDQSEIIRTIQSARQTAS